MWESLQVGKIFGEKNHFTNFVYFVVFNRRVNSFVPVVCVLMEKICKWMEKVNVDENQRLIALSKNREYPYQTPTPPMSHYKEEEGK